MTENSEFLEAEKRHNSPADPAAEGDSGQYIEGDYGDAGTVGDADAEGDSGQYVEGDHGDAGTVGEDLASAHEGQYPEGDYGDAGTVGDADAADGLADRVKDDQVDAPDSDRRDGDS